MPTPKHAQRPATPATRHDRQPAGAPVLTCNEWLAEQIRQGADPRTIKREWLHRHYEMRKYELADPHRSFRAAVDGCLRRLGIGREVMCND